MNKQEIESALQWISEIINNYGFEQRRPTVDEALAVKKALTQQLNNGWIPVSEQLPCDDECYRVFVTIKCKETGYISSARMRWFFGRFKWMNGSKLSSKFEVIAWIFDETPEPYKEESK